MAMQAQAQINAQEAQQDAALKARDQQMKEQQAQRDDERARQQAMFDQRLAQMDAQNQIQIERMKAAAQIEIERIKAAPASGSRQSSTNTRWKWLKTLRNANPRLTRLRSFEWQRSTSPNLRRSAPLRTDHRR
jgi:hypothetical protein